MGGLVVKVVQLLTVAGRSPGPLLRRQARGKQEKIRNKKNVDLKLCSTD
jgi:hypothetical protein